MAQSGISRRSILKIPILGRRKYHVFLSFRGKDTRHGFIARLYAKLKQMGIATFKDDQELKIGQAISSKLQKAIEQSSFSVVVISKNFASSTWCLDELQIMVESKELYGRKIFPIFYDVKPSDVRQQTGDFAKAFARHEKRFKNDKEKVQRWRNALTQVANLCGWEFKKNGTSSNLKDALVQVANLCGWELKKHRSCEAELIEIIAEALWIKLRPKYLFIFDILNKIGSKIEETNISIKVGKVPQESRNVQKAENHKKRGNQGRPRKRNIKSLVSSIKIVPPKKLIYW